MMKFVEWEIWDLRAHLLVGTRLSSESAKILGGLDWKAEMHASPYGLAGTTSRSHQWTQGASQPHGHGADRLTRTPLTERMDLGWDPRRPGHGLNG